MSPKLSPGPGQGLPPRCGGRVAGRSRAACAALTGRSQRFVLPWFPNRAERRIGMSTSQIGILQSQHADHAFCASPVTREDTEDVGVRRAAAVGRVCERFPSRVDGANPNYGVRPRLRVSLLNMLVWPVLDCGRKKGAPGGSSPTLPLACSPSEARSALP